MSQTRNFALSVPLTIVLSGAHGPKREQSIDSVSLRELSADDLTLLDECQGEPATLALKLVATLSGLTPAQVRRLDLDDFRPIATAAMMEIAHAAQGIGLPTGWFNRPAGR